VVKAIDRCVVFQVWLSELLIASIRSRWRWAHVPMELLFLFAACWPFASPFGAFWTLAAIFGLLLILRCSLDLVTSIFTGDQPRLVTGQDRGRGGDPARLLGLPAGVPARARRS
jgi:hypothetical protein